MSNEALTWAFKAPVENVGAKFVLVALADHASDHAGEDWTCFPSNERLMEFTSMPLRTVERHVSWLVANGWISRDKVRDRRGRLKDRHYRLHRHGPQAVAPVDQPAKTGSETPENRQKAPDLAGGETASPPAKKAGHHPPNRGQKAPDLAGGHNKDEPPEPSVTPTPGACADENRAFEALIVSYPAAGIDNTDIPAARSAFGVEAAAVGDPWAIVAAARAYADDPRTVARSFAPPGLHVWLKRGSYRGRLPRAGTVQGLGEGTRTGFAVPPAFRAAFVLANGDQGEVWAQRVLDRCGWRDSDQTLLAPTAPAEDWLRARGYRVERQAASAGVSSNLGVRVGECG